MRAGRCVQGGACRRARTEPEPLLIVTNEGADVAEEEHGPDGPVFLALHRDLAEGRRDHLRRQADRVAVAAVDVADEHVHVRRRSTLSEPDHLCTRGQRGDPLSVSRVRGDAEVIRGDQR